MPIDPKRMKPAEVVRLLNSAGYGEVLSERQLLRHRNRAGYAIGAEGVVDILRYAAWLSISRDRTAKPTEESAYDAHRERARKRNEAMSASGRNIGEIPGPANAERRERAIKDFQFFCEQYFPQTFHLKWSQDHIKVISRIREAVVDGGLFSMAMPRGSGKTSLCETACLWSIICGHRQFVALIGSDEGHAETMLDSIKTELETNDALHEDFPEVCIPIRALEGIHQRAGGQLYHGRPTYIGWTAKEIVLPTIPGSIASGSVMCVAGLTGRIRGMKHKRSDGSSIRPSLVLIDDPQTDESARSPSQCETRERILTGAVLGLAGPGKKIAGLMTLTVVRQDDLADRLLNRDKHPQWRGERTRMVYSWPTNEALWSKYSQLWRDGLTNDRGIAEATEFYRANREAMDAGSSVAWEERFEPGELSAIQHAMNLRLGRKDIAFFAEYQNDPLPEDSGDDDVLSADDVSSKTNGIQRGVVPLGANNMTMFIDVQGKALFWVVVAWEESFTGYVVDYGTEPDQRQSYFTLREAKRTLAQNSPRAGVEGAIYSGLERLADFTLGREWRREDGAIMRIERCMIDANWGQSTDVVYQFCRQSAYSSILLPSHGKYVGASSVPFSEYSRKPGDRIGQNWRIPIVSGKRSMRHMLYDTNFWKSFVHARLSVPMGDPGCLSLFGRNQDAHRLFADHITSEFRVRTEGRGRTVDEWKIRHAGSDNHWFDCLVGCAVSASVLGSSLRGVSFAGPKKRNRVRLSELQRAKRS